MGYKTRVMFWGNPDSMCLVGLLVLHDVDDMNVVPVGPVWDIDSGDDVPLKSIEPEFK